MEKQYSNQRRLRANKHIRELASTVTLTHLDFIQPLFVDESISAQTPINSLSGINSETIESALAQIESDLANGISKFLVFPIPKTKAVKDFNFAFVAEVVKKIRSVFGDRIWLALDACLCAYTSHGHCGILHPDGTRVLNHETTSILAKYSLQLAQAGADCIAPSDLMDGRIAAIRNILNENDFDHISIMSYSAKFSSEYYGPFRDACKSTPNVNNVLRNRKTYQISPFNADDAVQSSVRDWEEGADIVMVKPALLNSDILYTLKKIIPVPLAAYHVSGEYQSIELLARHGSLERKRGHVEVWISLKRAGADCIISYAARFAEAWIKKIEY